MNYINELLAELTSRLPELEWKVNGLSSLISGQNVPRGLFRSSNELTGSACVEEIKADIQALSHQKNERSAHFLANRIKQKVNVLVALCQIDSKKNKVEEKTHFGVKMLSTRQQWIENLEIEVSTLEKQQQAIAKALTQMKRTNANAAAILTVQSELGVVQKRLTLAREALNQATC
ncbi:primosomal replication protein PriC [Legionella maioricensis]|uniref:Primosomal replication protein n=1 Tax=Legionella maioricensis TaxID=2896528 RepID=A0A9X2CZX1_9GAMM|nr:primosomal replication protein PriC [Legionella maioricensis]MCL9683277.1 primosomal replication protein [Legionella maioricensis]MCL9686026.1 primosomal replication protein [Legionella maioricensis]